MNSEGLALPFANKWRSQRQMTASSLAGGTPSDHHPLETPGNVEALEATCAVEDLFSVKLVFVFAVKVEQ